MEQQVASRPVSQKPEFVETPPSPGRMAVAIAGYPYSPRAAIQDLVDNSVEAGAGGIAVVLAMEDKQLSSLAIVDNGSGIAPEILDEVLRAGSRTSHLYGEQSLSRYGIGLKGAGFALGSRITLLTRSNGQPIRRRMIDLSEIQKHDKWIQETREPNDRERLFFESSIKGLPGDEGRQTGTVVLIEGLNIRSRDITRLKNDLIRGIGETYNKFLGAKLRVRIDGVDVDAIDPLQRDLPGTVVFFQNEEIKLSDGGSLWFSAVALPHPNQVPAEFGKRTRYYQKDQGIYVYRNGRLVMGGQTLDLFIKDWHLQAFRAEIEYVSSADDHILVDVAKSNVVLSAEARGKLQDMVTTCTKTAQTLWREKDVLTPDDIKGIFDESNRLIEARYKLLVDTAEEKKKQKKIQRVPQGAGHPKPSPPPKRQGLMGYLKPVPTLPEDVLYRPVFDGELGKVVVEVNLAHPFSKAVFSVSPGETKNSVPRRATTAIQRLLYVLGHAEDGLSEDEANREVFEQCRRYASMNLRALLAD